MAFNIIDSDLGILEPLAGFRLLTGRQLAFLTGRNLQAMLRRLRVLVESGSIENFGPYKLETGPGRPVDIFGLTEAGIGTLIDTGKLKPLAAIAGLTGKSILTEIRHQQMVNTFRFGLRILEKHSSEFSCRDISCNSLYAIEPDTGHSVARMLGSRDDDPAGRDKISVLPDCVFHIRHHGFDRPLLFFLEADTGSEPLTGSDPRKATIDQKLRKYAACFRSRAHGRFEAYWKQSYNGFRLLFLCASEKRTKTVAKHVSKYPSLDFVWVSRSFPRGGTPPWSRP